MNKREDVVQKAEKGGVGAELGVAEGEFSERVLRQQHFNHFYSIDMWAGDRDHDIEQYKRVIKRLCPYKANNTILKMRFDQALDLFEDGSLDFVYVDGYAHTAQENGKTLEDWYRKVKPYGIMAGDDYHEHFRDNVTQIDLFKDRHSLQINVIECHEPNSVWSEYPTWWVKKIPPVDLKGKTVAVVGNSSSLFTQNYGAEIDSHDVVIRMNRCTNLFYDGDCAKSHGTKFDIWGTWNVNEYENCINEFSKQIVHLAPWHISKFDHVLCYTFAEGRELMAMYDNQAEFNPSTGLSLLHWISKRDPASVDIYGFDWKKTPTWTDPKRIIDSQGLHDFEQERTIIENYFCKKLGYKVH